MRDQTVTKEAIKKVLHYYIGQYKKYPLTAGIAFLLPAIGTIFVFFVPPLVLSKIVNVFSVGGSISLQSTVSFIAIFAGSWLLGEILWRVGMHFMIKLQGAGNKNLSLAAFRMLSDRDYSFYSNNFVGSLSNKAKSFIFGFEGFSDTIQYNFLSNLFTIVFATIVLWQYSPLLPLVLLSCVAILIAVAIPQIRKRSRFVAERHASGSAISGRLSDVLTNMFAVKSFSGEEHEYRLYEGYANDYVSKFRRAANFHNLRIDTLISPLYVLTNVLGLVTAIFVASKLQLQPGVLVVVFSYYTQVTYVFWQINYVYRNIESAIGSAAEFTQLFLEPPLVSDKPQAKSLVVKEGTIEFKDVSFDYKSEKTNTFFKNFSLVIPAGQKVGLVGPSGGGKTTITKLLLRFVDIQKGTIMIDGHSLSEITQKSLREAIAYVPQEPLLFHRSIFENIIYGNPNATKEEVEKAAHLARADEFIEKLSNKYNTLVGERGIKLSGGQRQRIAIARTILKQSKILILDEATSALDSESEKYIQEGLKELMKDKTAIVIAHRLSTIKHLDRIIVLDEGKIVQDGPHEELIKQKDSLYAKLWNHQSGGFLEE